jgi:hypothetical protein
MSHSAGPLSGKHVNGGRIVSESELVLATSAAHTAVTRSALHRLQPPGARRDILAAALRRFHSGAWPLLHRYVVALGRCIAVFIVTFTEALEL